MYFYLLAIKTIIIIIIIIDILKLELLEEPNSLNNICCFQIRWNKVKYK